MITVVVACRDDQVELGKTLASLKATAFEDFDAVVVDDGSKCPVVINLPWVTVIRNRWPIGVGASRHIGVLAAKGETVLITDSHMSFCPGWDAPLANLAPTTLLCGQTLALTESDESWEQASGEYYGARMVLLDPNAELARYRFLDARWADPRGDSDLYPLSAVMGALYAFNRQTFLKIGGLRLLRGFGCDEELLSLKWMRCGGEILFCRKLRAGHKFRKGNRAPYPIMFTDLYWNKLMIAHTCTEIAPECSKLLGVGCDIKPVHDLLRQNWNLIATERAFMDSIFTVSWPDYLAKVAEIG